MVRNDRDMEVYKVVILNQKRQEKRKIRKETEKRNENSLTP